MTNPPPLRILVTGATGFLGRNALAAIARRPHVIPIAACRDRSRLAPFFRGEVRVGDLTDPAYRRAVVQDVDVVCHAGTWGAFWGHRQLERTRFFEPARDLMECAIAAGVQRFVQNSTVVVAAPSRDGTVVADDAPGRPTGFWPHLDYLIELERFMQANAGRGTQMVSLRLGHFVGHGNRLGLVAALAPRLRTRVVPWLAGGRSRLPLVADADLGEAFACAATAPELDAFESFNIRGPELPTAREVITFIARQSGAPAPWVSVPFFAGYAFGWLMETLFPILPGPAPFLTRSIVHVAEDWPCSNDRAQRKLGYMPAKDWRTAVTESLQEHQTTPLPWQPLAQPL